MRVPAGMLWVVALAALVVIAVAYSWGYARGKNAGVAEGLRQLAALEETKATTRAVQDPLAGSQMPPMPPAAPPAANGDPRAAGYWYFTIARPGAAGAPELLAFCRSEGLDAYLVSDDNGKSRKIIVNPPFYSQDARRLPKGQEVEAKIKTVGNRWKAKAKGNRNFSDAQLELFKG